MSAHPTTHAAPAPERARRVGPLPLYLTVADFIGFDIDLVDDIVGDLFEECAQRRGDHGTVLARLWCAAQLARSLPYLALSTLRRGQPRARLRLVATMSTMLLAATAVVAAMQMRDGPPARILADRAGDDGIVINNIKPVKLPMRVLDARGHTLEALNVRYEVVSGDRLNITPSGVLTCGARGDAVVRAKLEDIIAVVNVRCRPVNEIHASSWIDLMPDDAPRAIPFVAVDNDGEPVGQLRGSLQISDSTVARVTKSTVAPLAIGESRLNIAIGDRVSHIEVIVYEPVTRFDNLKPTQHNVAIPIRVARGDTIEFPVPAGTMWVKYMPHDGGIIPPTISMQGNGGCEDGEALNVHYLPIDEYGARCYAGRGTRLRVAHGAVGGPVLTGALMLQRASP